jgi:N-hydroxyarylamine O-acetyltransferase
MKNVNALFRNKIGFSEDETITFEKLDEILEKTAKAIPFENLSILSKKSKTLTKENLVDKIIIRNEGGLCYDLNSLLYLFLVENGFDVSLIRGIIYDHGGQRWNTIGNTHVVIIMTYHDQLYLIDTGFGGNLPLKPVPFTGEIVNSKTGEFRVEKIESEHGDHMLFLKLHDEDKNWKIGYAFQSTETIKNISELDEVQRIIKVHQDSPFNKQPLLTMLTDNGSVTLTETSFTKWVEGKVEKIEIDQNDFKEISKDYFGIEID